MPRPHRRHFGAGTPAPPEDPRPPTYDSDRRGGLRTDLAALGAHRHLVWMLTRRELRLRYARSALGVAWTVALPLLETAVLWLVFSQAFRFTTDVPYVVYLLSGLLVANLCRRTILGVAASVVRNGQLLARFRLPDLLFPVSAALELALSFAVSLAPLLAVVIVAGPGLSATAPLVVLPIGLLVLGCLGVGLVLAPLAIKAPDAIILAGVGLTLLQYLTPVFYPVEVIPEKYRWIVAANPLKHFVSTFRSMLYAGQVGGAADWGVMLATGIVLPLAGLVIYRRLSRGILAEL